ncbi:MAG: hypothetical protein DRI65_15810 [Chloroflexota bacterium]|nr:MAG: hypothetical protein DRI65_15810 [Chloroflexota bacterium]
MEHSKKFYILLAGLVLGGGIAFGVIFSISNTLGYIVAAVLGWFLFTVLNSKPKEFVLKIASLLLTSLVTYLTWISICFFVSRPMCYESYILHSMFPAYIAVVMYIGVLLYSLIIGLGKKQK